VKFLSYKKTLLISLLALSTHVSAQPVAQVKTQAPGYYRMMLGNFEVTALLDGTAVLPMDKLLQGAPKESINRLLAAQSLSTQVETPINTFLINTGSHLILVDTGAGAFFGPAGGHLLDNLRASGYTPEQIDTVLLTHIHSDHIGGLSHNGKPAFPNATVFVSKIDADYWLSAAHLEQAKGEEQAAFKQANDALQPIVKAGKLKTFSDDSQILPGVTPILAAGHTPGHTLFQFESDGQKLLAWGDVMHSSAVQMPEPKVTVTFDADSTQARKSREKILATVVNSKEWVAGAHLAFPGLGHVTQGGSINPPSYQWVPANYSLAGLKP
jgi:glyoxylase-like metal-dependent hydrolase (beta-lactamase superfamily II)